GPGVARAREGLGSSVCCLLHGDEDALTQALEAYPLLKGRAEVWPAASVVALDEKPAQALRRGKGSSMWNAVEAIRNGEAGAAVSAGNTGALKAVSKLITRMGAGLDRP